MRATPYPSRFSLAQDRITRREFALGAASLALARTQEPSEPKQSRVALARAGSRKESLAEALALWGEVAVEGKEILLKASFNSPDESPATTSPETLAAVIEQLRARRCGRIRLVERSGMGRTRDIWDRLGITDLARRLDLALVPLDELAPEEWRHAELSGSHWSRGVELPGFLDRESTLVEISNCKTHRFGGHFSASLKNAVGLIAKYSRDGKRHNYMTELHASPDQRLMIAEVNQLFAPALVVLDATEVFVDGGPEQGDLAYPQVVAVATDRA